MAIPKFTPPPYKPTAQNSTRQDTWEVRLEVAGNNFGVWDKKTGGELDSDEVVYYPGGMDPKLSLGGRAMPGNITLQKIYDGVDDHQRVQALLNAVGRHSCKVTQQPLDFEGNRYGQKFMWSGKVKRVLVPDHDSEATGAAMIEVEITIEDRPHLVDP